MPLGEELSFIDDYEREQGLRSWKLGGRLVLVCSSEIGGGPARWAIRAQAESFSGTTIWVESKLSRDDARHLLRRCSVFRSR